MDGDPDHSLIVKPGTALEDVRKVMSHPQALGQCSEFIYKHNQRIINGLHFKDKWNHGEYCKHNC